MGYWVHCTCKLKQKFLAADIFDGRLEKFGLKEKQWEPERVQEWAARGRLRLLSDGQHRLKVQVELDGSVEYVEYSWYSNHGPSYYQDILEKLEKALNTEAEGLYSESDDVLQLLHYCSEHGIDTGLEYDRDDPHRHEKYMAWLRDEHDAVEAAVEAHVKKHAPPVQPEEDAPVVDTAASDFVPF